MEHQNLVDLQIHIMQQKSAVSGTQVENFCILVKESMSSVFKYYNHIWYRFWNGASDVAMEIQRYPLTVITQQLQLQRRGHSRFSLWDCSISRICILYLRLKGLTSKHAHHALENFSMLRFFVPICLLLVTKVIMPLLTVCWETHYQVT